MPINTPHSDYTENIAKWLRCRDAYDGEDAVKAREEVYLPKLSGQDDYEYGCYVKRAYFYGAMARTIQGLVGTVLRRPPELKCSDSLMKAAEHLTESGSPLDVLIDWCLEEELTTGRYGILIDAQEGSQPYTALYYAENILNWRYDWVKGQRQLVWVVVQEDVEITVAGDPYDFKKQCQFREMELSEGVYRVRVWSKKESNDGKAEEYQAGPWMQPAGIGGRNFDYIPMVIANSTGPDEEIIKPPLMDLVNTNISHYRNSADHEHGLHYTALPTAWAVGFSEKGSLKIGSSVAWVSDNPQARAGFLEFEGAGLESIANAMKNKEKHMAILGAKLLEEQQREAESADAVKMRHKGQDNTLGMMADGASEALTLVLQHYSDWLGIKDSASISLKLNKHYDTKPLPSDMLIAMVQSVQAGQMSWDTLFFNCKNADLYPEDRTVEDEKSLIKENPPIPVTAAGSGQPKPQAGAASGSLIS